MAYEFARSVAEVIANIEAFTQAVATRHNLPQQENHDLQILVARTELWVLYRDPKGQWVAGPSKYVALRNITPALYSKIRRDVNSGNAANHLRIWLPKQPVSQSHPGWQVVVNLAKAHTIGGRCQRDAAAFVLLDALGNCAAPEATNELEVSAETSSGASSQSSPLILSEIEKLEVNLMVALARTMRREVRNIALQELVTI
jgi:hypothetical protein